MKHYGWRNPEEQRESYAYDGLRRLAGVNIAPLKNNGSAVAMSYAYDAVGNRLTWAADDDLSTQQPGDGFSKNYAYNAANQLLRAETKSLTPNPNRSPIQEYRYDGNGSRIGRTERDSNGPVKGTDYSFDPENRLIRALDYQLTGKGGRNRIDRAVTALDYDGGGRRLAQSYDPKAGRGGVKRTEYAFDRLDPVAEYNQLNGQYDNYYRGADDQIITSQHFSSGAPGQLHWYHYDRKGDVAGLTKQNGNAAHTYRYEPYGAVIPENGNFTDPHNHYTLTGKEFDENTGLVWFGARHYEPETGLWMGQDVYRGTLDEPGSLHRFAYVNDNPINLYDPYGYFFETFWDVANVAYDAGAIIKNITEVGWEGGKWTVGALTNNEMLKSQAVDGLKRNGGELGSATLDLTVDVVATAIPFVPAGGSKIARYTLPVVKDIASNSIDQFREIRRNERDSFSFEDVIVDTIIGRVDPVTKLISKIPFTSKVKTKIMHNLDFFDIKRKSVFGINSKYFQWMFDNGIKQGIYDLPSDIEKYLWKKTGGKIYNYLTNEEDNSESCMPYSIKQEYGPEYFQRKSVDPAYLFAK